MKKTLIAVAGIATLLGSGTVLAKSSLGTVTAPNGVQLPKVGIEGTVTAVSGERPHQLTVTEKDGTAYTVKVGPNATLSVGESIKVEGVEKTSGTIGAWKITKADGTEVTLRTKVGRPDWAGKGNGNQRKGFVDENKDGTCDKRQ